MANSKKGESIVWNVIGAIIGIFAVVEMIQLITTASRFDSRIGLYGAASCGILSAFLIIYNGIRIRQKKGLGGKKQKNAAKAKPATSRPRPRPSSASDAQEAFISEIQDGRCYDLFARNRLGVAELYVDVDFEDGVYYLKPEIEVTYDKDAVRSQSDVDRYDDFVVDEYQKQFNDMVEICEAWGVNYDIAEPEVTTNIKNGRIV